MDWSVFSRLGVIKVVKILIISQAPAGIVAEEEATITTTIIMEGIGGGDGEEGEDADH